MSDRRYKALGEPPIVVFVVEDDAKAQQFLRPADKVVTGGLGTWGTPKANYYAYGYRRMWKALLRPPSGCRAAGCSGSFPPTASRAPSAGGKPWRTTKPDPHAHRRPDLV